jgi:hypothetical protein
VCQARKELIQEKQSSKETLKILIAARTLFEQEAGTVEYSYKYRCSHEGAEKEPIDNVNFVKLKVLNLLRSAVLKFENMLKGDNIPIAANTDVQMSNPYCV